MNVEELTVNYSENDQVIVKELDKVILSRGAYATIVFIFEEWDRDEKTFSKPKMSIRRYRKRGKIYVVEKFITLGEVSSLDEMIEIMKKWKT